LLPLTPLLPLPLRTLHKSLDQRRLADPCLTADQHRLPRASRGQVEQRIQLGGERLALDQFPVPISP